MGVEWMEVEWQVRLGLGRRGWDRKGRAGQDLESIGQEWDE